MSRFLLDADKRYRAVFKLGQRTTTGDAEGEVVSVRPVEGITQAAVRRAMERFRGEIEQTPPMHSAIKYHGQRLYKLAHQGLVVERKPRTVTIYELEVLDFKDNLITVEALCSKGTYIRTLAEDIGEVLGCGAHVSALRRTGSGPFDDTQLVTAEHLQQLAVEGFEALDALLLPMESALSDWPDVKLPEGVAYYIEKGEAVMVPHAPTHGWVKIYGQRDRFMGVGEVLDDGRIAPRRLVQAGS